MDYQVDGETLNLNNSAYIPLPEELLMRSGQHFSFTIRTFKSRSPQQFLKASFSRKTSQTLGSKSQKKRLNSEYRVLRSTTPQYWLVTPGFPKNRGKRSSARSCDSSKRAIFPQANLQLSRFVIIRFRCFGLSWETSALKNYHPEDSRIKVKVGEPLGYAWAPGVKVKVRESSRERSRKLENV